MPAIATAVAAAQRVNVFVLSQIEVYFDSPNIQIRLPSTVIWLTSFTLWIEIAFSRFVTLIIISDKELQGTQEGF